MTTTQPFDVLAIGRSGVDIYPLQIGVGLENVESFGKFLGGSAANVAVAAARLGNRTALISGVGADPFGTFVRNELADLGVDNSLRDDPRRVPDAGDVLRDLPAGQLPALLLPSPQRAGPPDPPRRDRRRRRARSAKLYWSTVTGLSEEPSRSAHFAAWEARARARTHGARPRLPADVLGIARSGHRAGAASALQHVTVAVGNREECEIAVGESNPQRAADALLDLGVELAIVKQGPRGVLGKTKHSHVSVPPNDVDVVNGLGAGDAFGGSLCHGLLHGWTLEKTLRYANAAGAIVASRLECSTAMPTAAEVAALADQTAVEAVNV